ncbi:hypothetical protein P175DRAFT_0520009 [Aspergillus ochraceoroseus IBT 24754]|uniref:Uncharacterized protein n=2 Tax=Aspergillus ochraceoroseus TaxID=138278 RepID=A0A2T5M661_9EURO|nr:uncharacterized protein P175DRAFT_0520009 [Aspergillus ochraceoroseus IBT 24754]KKK22910.1 hypothetical protein AOCH_000521 [Aspergillus ochraceoroseus]PTU24025.1 hypothetical protein P175DRAFT_0520009 [Aspergillus ochraceoroseus IBT 24754]
MADMDEFAQTRGADDLFDDEIIPVAAEEQARPETQVPGEEEHVTPPAATATTTTELETTPTRTDTPPRSRGGERRGRGKGRGRGGRGAHNSGPRRTDAPKNKVGDIDAEPEVRDGEENPAEVPVEKTEQSNKDEAAAAAAAAAAGPEAPRVPAVRGDRSATGGIKKPKLTEEELSRRIAAARENAAKVAAAHARAEADQASFLEREKIAEKKRREERQNRKIMDSERERNRLRKLEALNGREWDADKQEDQFSGRGGKQFRRGMHGGVSGYGRRDVGESQVGEEPPPHSPRGRGRGGRGGRGRGGQRGPRDASSSDRPSEAPQISGNKTASSAPGIDNEAEFPSLPGGGKKDKVPDKAVPPLDDLNPKPLSPVSGATWAEQVEAQPE